MNTIGARFRWLWRVINLSILLVIYAGLTSCVPITPAPPSPTETPIPPDPSNITVTVLGVEGTPLLNGVVIRVTNSTESDGQDHDSLKLDSCLPGQFIAAWAPGYRVGYLACDGKTTTYSIPLQALPNLQDNINYSWASAAGRCRACHEAQLNASYNEFREWELSGHATVFLDDYFETMYRGTDVSGVSGPTTEWMFVGDKLVRAPKINAPEYKGPGFQLDFPGQAGNCAFCHAPAAILASRAEVDLSPLFFANDARMEGISCDVCHKVNNVLLNSDGYPFVDKPGMLSMQFLRSDGIQIGPFANVVSPLPNVNLPIFLCSEIFSRSEFCAPCHYGNFGDTLVYNSYGEWKGSSYAKNPGDDGYRTCQDCHMSRMQNGDPTPYSRRKACSETAPGFQDLNHNLMDFGPDEKLGWALPRMIRGAAQIGAEFDYKPEESNSLKVHVVVQNTKAGHKFPTDSPLRHLILVVEARDQFGNTLMQLDGGQIPIWGGVSDAYMENNGVKGYAGLPGKIFANVLVEEDTNISPSAAYWNETKPALVTKDGIASDNRLEPGGKDASNYFFAVPGDGEVRFKLSLIYRFGFYDLMKQKRWADHPDRKDIFVTIIECQGNIARPNKIECSQTDP